ncbi:S-layer homology domain-containing protein [Fervidobacterium pennivorans subsp. shakshaketiis]|jgi:chromosome segregation ATPase|uniref:S-layer protein n=1 Tax=Fervidobacterium pennivorans (strain DSM 9078 / Ven5) TaxID=771875 RepID=H9UEM9_FERPD|nr:S-layer homology domain-containing protein [Fervidobacterium pennivorans]AFG35972.1 putative S-layer protein [Fervidobacterium pennivorans DSM 9078]
MKKVLTIAVVLLVLSISMAAFRDIPKGHWAESFVTRLEEAGIATGFPDGTYRGDEAITRYQIAVFLVRTLDYVFQTVESNINEKVSALKQDIEELQIALEDAKVVLDLHDQDIIKLYDLVNSLQDKFNYTDEDGNQQEIDLVALKNDIQAISEILNGLAAQLGDVDYLLRKQIADTTKDLQGKIDAINKNIADINNQLAALQEAQVIFESRLNDLDETIANSYAILSDAIMGIQEELNTSNNEMKDLLETKADKETLATLVSRVELLEEYVNMIYDVLGTKVSAEDFEAAMAGLDDRLSELETKVLNIQSTIDTGLPAIRDMLYELSSNLASLEERVTTYTDVRVEAVEENLGILAERVNLLENQVASLGQIVEEVKADKSEVEDVNKKLEELKAEKSKDVKRLEQLAQWGIGLGIVGIIIGLVGWFKP